jgi:hypothetical protein
MGRLRRLPAAWTSMATLSPFEAFSDGRSHFRVEDLLQLATFIAREREVQEEATSGADTANVPSK